MVEIYVKKKNGTNRVVNSTNAYWPIVDSIFDILFSAKISTVYVEPDFKAVNSKRFVVNVFPVG